MSVLMFIIKRIVLKKIQAFVLFLTDTDSFIQSDISMKSLCFHLSFSSIN